MSPSGFLAVSSACAWRDLVASGGRSGRDRTRPGAHLREHSPVHRARVPGESIGRSLTGEAGPGALVRLAKAVGQQGMAGGTATARVEINNANASEAIQGDGAGGSGSVGSATKRCPCCNAPAARLHRVRIGRTGRNASQAEGWRLGCASCVARVLEACAGSVYGGRVASSRRRRRGGRAA